mmetsp:Transcript_14899/g.24643  ORF Transcript_14899/g.24643 Transcript_14899/m.24643 type:complete len:389 (+) Transcript_14899:98-1264(+)|eukprot:CAMPEP_0119012504 /NCGR_PEP_ID=MMETSP1176-20130426/6826_1 /TAXON_ID=265551 /ORGANISM="Synedropsis recta cf, Strain CCMP1620" /LENGTH=388 /DNA_ID=CAMNT_0006965481 /DNA_START=33 /DNA_END=1199 /DNA_ORIENTATION=-
MSKEPNKKKKPIQHLVAGGCAGLVESSICHPLDTIKTRLQLRRQSQTIEAIKARSSMMEPALRLKHSMAEPLAAMGRGASWAEPKARVATDGAILQPGVHEPAMKMTTTTIRPPTRPVKYSGTAVTAPLGPLGTAKRIIKREGFLALYKGLGAVYTGIVPKMAIRFLSFEQYKEGIWKYVGSSPTASSTIFFAGLASGLTEAILVVTPAEVCKIRMQGQYNSMMDPAQLAHRKYTNVLQTASTIVREEGMGALYKGLVPTMLRQGCNQAVNFTAYQNIKRKVLDYQGGSELQHWQSLVIGGLSGGMGPLVNNPLDVVKTRLQKQVVIAGKTPKYSGLVQSCGLIAKEEGVLALWKGITPRLLRIMPGQAITFMTYEATSTFLHRNNLI